MMDNILDCDNNIRDCENTCKQRIHMEEVRDYDIDVAQQQKSKLDTDLLLMLKDIGSGLLLFDYAYIILRQY
mgnify:CR=1 FL=1